MNELLTKLTELGIPDKWIKNVSERRAYLQKIGVTYYPLEDDWDIKFECIKCGKCCREVEYTVGKNVIVDSNTITLIPEEIYRISDFLKIFPLAFLSKFCQISNVEGKKVANWKANPCSFLSKNLCTIHKVRPDTCKFYPANAISFSIVKNPICEGFGKGNLLDLIKTRRLLIERINKVVKNLENAPTKEKKFKKRLLERK